MIGRLLGVGCVLTSLLALGEPAIILLPRLGRPDKVTLAGRVLREKPSSGSSKLSKNLRRLLAPNWEGAPVEAALGDGKGKTESTKDGEFEVAVSQPAGKSYAAGMQTAAAHVPGADAHASIQVVADAPFFVVSDFDDTIAVTNVLHPDKLISTALLKDGETQPPVDGMAAWYRCLRDAGAPFALVSGSPVQYADRLEAFLSKNDFPFMGLYLRDLGPGTMKNYKQPFIRALLKELPMNSVCIGDSGEHDPEVYAEIDKEFPGRVMRIYIHDVGRDEDTKRFEGMFLFKDPRDAAADAVARGYMKQECFEKAFPK